MLNPDVFSNRVFERMGRMGTDACQIMAAAINAVDPCYCVRDELEIKGEHLRIGNRLIHLKDFDRIFLFGFGKASVPMARGGMEILQGLITKAVVITKDPRYLKDPPSNNKLQILVGGHPLPTNKSIQATKKLLEGLPVFTSKDLILLMISGGGSALFTLPVDGVTLEEIKRMTDLLLKSGATIQEINTLRKHLDQVKGGRLAVRMQPARIETLILSDVVGDPLDMIASGPTVPDPTTFSDVESIIKKYQLEDKLPESILQVIKGGLMGQVPETLKTTENLKSEVNNHLVGTNYKAALTAKKKASDLGYNSLIISSQLTGLTENVAEFLNGIIQTELAYNHPERPPLCLIFGGETTVKVKGDGWGGRNQDLALRMVPMIAGKEGVLFFALATDGEDGNSDAAGAASDATVLRDGLDLKLNVTTYIDTNNSYHYFRKVGGLITIGSTSTNVNDLIFIMIKSPN